MADYASSTRNPSANLAHSQFKRSEDNAMPTKSLPSFVGLSLLVWLAIGSLVLAEEVTWQKRVIQQLPLLGHRNWIVSCRLRVSAAEPAGNRNDRHRRGTSCRGELCVGSD